MAERRTSSSSSQAGLPSNTAESARVQAFIMSSPEILPEEIAVVLGIKLARVRKVIDRMRQAGKLERACYKLVPRTDGTVENRSSVEIAGFIVLPGGAGLGYPEASSLQVRIVDALRHGSKGAGELAQSVGVSVHDGAFRRACRNLVEKCIVFDWRIPWPKKRENSPIACENCSDVQSRSDESASAFRADRDPDLGTPDDQTTRAD